MARPATAGISAWDPIDLGAPVARDHEGEVPRPAAGEPGRSEPAGLLEEAALRERTLATALEQERAERERLVAEAFERGLAAGRLEGRQMESERLRGALTALETATAVVRDHGPRWGAVTEENVCALALAIARHILGRELDGDRLAVLGLAREAVASFGVDDPLRIRVNERDHRLLCGARQEVDLASAVAGREVVWVADPSIEVGGCIVEGPDRIVDGRVDTALERVYRRLTLNHA